MRIALVAGFALMGTSAMAADLYVPVEPMIVPVASSHDWSGFYAGVFGGLGGGPKSVDFMNNGFQATVDEDPFLLTDTPDTWYAFDVCDIDGTGFWGGDWTYCGEMDDASGGFVGAAAGYNVQSGDLVFGVEGDVAWSNITANGSSFWDYDYGGADFGDTETTLDVSLDAFATLRGRAGLAMDRFLPYVTAGVAWGSVTTSVDSYNTNNIVDDTFIDSESSTESMFGFAAGLGAEYAVTDTIRVKAEYLYLDLGTSESTFEYSDDGGPYTASVDNKYHTVKVGVNFAF